MGKAIGLGILAWVLAVIVVSLIATPLGFDDGHAGTIAVPIAVAVGVIVWRGRQTELDED